MKKNILLVLVALSSICNAQNFTVNNITGRGKYFEYQYEKWNVNYLTVTKDTDNYKVSYQLYNVKESLYDEIPNDTTYYTFTGDFEKFTRKDGKGYTLIHCEEQGYINYTVTVTESDYSDEITIMIYSQVLTSGYVVFIDNKWICDVYRYDIIRFK